MTSNAHETMIDEEDNDYAYRDISCTKIMEEEEKIQISSHYSCSHWTRAIIEILVKLENLDKSIVALIDHDLEINLVSKELYERGKWLIVTKHGWMISASKNS